MAGLLFAGGQNEEALKLYGKKPRPRPPPVDFYIGAYQAARGALEDARPLLRSAADKCRRDFVEYDAAKLELKRLDSPARSQAKQ